ncbi:MAG: serine/threonine protein kinase [Nocardiaceae bacterium]|nr:serine/threonine protein kinase [Nocardiaceae bacterium]
MEVVAFGRYQLLGLIGSGAMGKVYKAHDSELDRDVAIKVLPTELAGPEYRKRFKREAVIAARLTEPHIVQIHDVGEFDGRLYLVMPIIDGVDMQALLRRDGPMNPQRAVHLIEQLASALDAAHRAGLVHRDVKPANALVTKQDFAYLIDFGIAQADAATRMTSTGKVIGTFAYMAPERFRGIADARSDIYALTCVLYECLTGVTPYPGWSVEEQIAGHQFGVPPKPSLLNPAIPAAFDEVIATGLAKEPVQRYQTAGDLAEAARRALVGTGPGGYRPAPTMVDIRPPKVKNSAASSVDSPSKYDDWDRSSGGGRSPIVGPSGCRARL